MAESEELYLLRYRYGRAAEMLVAYKTFLNKEVKIGSSNYCQTDEVVARVTHTLLVTFYSFIYSLFDQSGTDFIKTTEPYLNVLTDDGKTFRKELVDMWEENKTAISKLRHNVGFHGGKKLKTQEIGYSALKDFDPQTSELIMTFLSLFFIELDKVVAPNENYQRMPDQDKIKKFMLERSEKLKAKMKDNHYWPIFKEVMDEIEALYKE